MNKIFKIFHNKLNEQKDDLGMQNTSSSDRARFLPGHLYRNEILCKLHGAIMGCLLQQLAIFKIENKLLYPVVWRKIVKSLKKSFFMTTEIAFQLPG